MPNNWWFDYDEDVWVCDECNGREFVNRTALDKHLEMSRNHNYCSQCDRDFVSWSALRSHLVNSSVHSYCTVCDTDFDDDEDLWVHQHEDHFPCQGCDDVFDSELGRYEHGRQSHSFCAEHRRAFLSDANLRAVSDPIVLVSLAGRAPTAIRRHSISNRARMFKRGSRVRAVADASLSTTPP